MILVVDESTDNIVLIRSFFEGQYRIKVASNGERAIKRAWSTPSPYGILLDIMAPRMDGF